MSHQERAKDRAGQEGLLGPLDGSAAKHINTVRQRVTLASVAVPSSKHNGLNPTIKLRQCHLHHYVSHSGFGDEIWASEIVFGIRAQSPWSYRQNLWLSAMSNTCSEHTTGISMQ